MSGGGKGAKVSLPSQSRDKAKAMQAYARQAKNRQLEIQAADIRDRAERRIGELMAAQREAGLLPQGNPEGWSATNGSVLDPLDMPVAGGEVDAAAFARRLAGMRPCAAIIERASAMPRQGVSSTFKFGAAFGAVRGVVQALGVPMHMVAAGRWKKHFSLDADKEKSRALAIRLWPRCPGFERKRDHGRAEAALIARYGAETVLRMPAPDGGGG